VQARLTSAFFAIALVVVVYFLAYDVAGPRCGLIAALFTTTDSPTGCSPYGAAGGRNRASVLARAAAIGTGASPTFGRAGIRRRSIVRTGTRLPSHGVPFFVAMVLYCCAQYGWIRVEGAGGLGDGRRGGAGAIFGVVLFRCGAHHRIPGRLSGPRPAAAARPFLRGTYTLDRFYRRLQPAGTAAPAHTAGASRCVDPGCGGGVFRCRDRRYAVATLALLGLSLGWLFFMITKTPRYLSILAPLFAIALAYFAVKSGAGWQGKVANAALARFCSRRSPAMLSGCTAIGTRITPPSRQLQNIVPKGASVYGVITFWMALHDRTYYGYERRDLDRAVAELRPRYMILYDRVMVHGSGYTDDWATLREKLTGFVHSHGTLAGRVSNEFYGDLEVSRITY
jgi:hypothetical protein